MKDRLMIYGLGIFGIVILGGIFLPRLANRNRPTIPLARTDIQNLDAALSQYYAVAGEYPSGTKVEIFKKLLGENARGIKFFSVNPKSVNSSGEFTDPWKTPYEMNIVQTNYTIRSAGPNRIFGDEDDITNSRP